MLRNLSCCASCCGASSANRDYTVIRQSNVESIGDLILGNGLAIKKKNDPSNKTSSNRSNRNEYDDGAGSNKLYRSQISSNALGILKSVNVRGKHPTVTKFIKTRSVDKTNATDDTNASKTRKYRDSVDRYDAYNQDNEDDDFDEDDDKKYLIDAMKVNNNNNIDANGDMYDLILCWISGSGELFHFYNISDKDYHVEHTYVGDAFVIYKHPRMNKYNNTRMAKEIKYASEIAKNNIILFYRPMAALTPGYQVHRIEFDENDIESTTVSIENVLTEVRVSIDAPKLQKFKNDLPSLSSSVNEPWEVKYKFIVPNMPDPDEFNPNFHTFYVWGDLSFDIYGADGPHSFHKNKMCQIVPQVMLGSCLFESSGHPDYKPGFKVFKSWVAQAQYYWQDRHGEIKGSHALCGKIVPVTPGQEVESCIRYHPYVESDPESGGIHISIAGSEIYSKSPFPGEFLSWSEFFTKCFERTKGKLHGRPNMNIEYKSDSVSLIALQSICPFKVSGIVYPNLPPAKDWDVRLFNVPEEDEEFSLSADECVNFL